MSEIIFDSRAVNQALDVMAEKIAADEVYIVGIQRGGAEVADALQHRLQKTAAVIHRGNLDISFYRDDLDTIGPNPEVRCSELPFDLTDKQIYLVDDVLYTGRTIRAALGEIFDYGRPASVKLVVLVDRGGHQLPIAADIVGLLHHAGDDQSVKLMTDPDGWYIERRQVK
ncbi:MAG: bifunctional pyr operon transcriptional regulator/uracil phosphoribosyltransferase PyrR [Zetaproteobacteria bacterium CG_4_9_14_3_um_filter_49_83]|nr:MAG: aldose epimerase [Zetaproteobacteria bacterium CG1_02_49_23]PIQ33165.1 MAG: bifunctional pyr operon transcriptional regulator/uracil phosphoribosyltransferase [Zetaproteobacteria bacterium CG17_big_fil_post_rev_8_21_14_2_50_50_13]PIV29368.1 MAG: bifunctional pyr operon transcriptional regulator/uracil phosphoribosyltransferase PyrR [Zetaproteobacteria bacterium CG02_land_8_20_14_3_00_50_9]PIY54802.1 MAG: bifunctional pyr operon transcriptional regulator/uracil phosphoribosyltransferase P